MLLLLLCTARVYVMYACPCVFTVTYRGGGKSQRSLDANEKMIDLSLATNPIHHVRT